MRNDYITWDDFFMGVAELASKRSKDPRTRHGACIIDSENRIISVGYNGLPRGLNDNGKLKPVACDKCNGRGWLWWNELDEYFGDASATGIDDTRYLCDKCNGKCELDINYWDQPYKHEYVVHAEENAIFNATTSLKNTILYLYSEKGYYPCARCARGIIQNGIKEVVMKTAIKENSEHYDWSHTKHMFEACGVKIRVLKDEKIF